MKIKKYGDAFDMMDGKKDFANLKNQVAILQPPHNFWTSSCMIQRVPGIGPVSVSQENKMRQLFVFCSLLKKGKQAGSWPKLRHLGYRNFLKI